MIGLERRVVIVDDSRTIQAMLDNAFSTRKDFRVVGFAADATTAVEVIRRLMPDIVTIDLCMPYLDGEALLELIKDLTSICKVVVSDKAVENRLLSSRLIKAGASLCLAKSELAQHREAFFKKVNQACDKAGTKRHHLSSQGGLFDERAHLHAGAPDKIIPFPVPADEKRRLDIASRKSLFNAAPEPMFDLITRNSARLAAFPIALLTFIDRDTQWVKSCFGLAIEQTPREQAFCNYTISQGGAFVVANAATDERFAANPLVTGTPHIRTYTGFPVVTADGVTVGSLCLIDTRVRTVSKNAIDQLAGMAEIAGALIDERPALAA